MPKTVCIVGLAPTSRDLIAHEPDDGREMWGLNQAHNYYTSEIMGRFTRWFQIHPWAEMVPRQVEESGHLEFLRTCGIPVYLETEQPEEVPTGRRYPYPEISDSLGGAYLTSAPAFMLALALYERFDEIRVYGVDMASHTEYEDQRPCFEFLLGMAIASGAQVWLPPGCPLLKGPLYAKTVYVTTSRIELLMRSYMTKRDQQLAKYNELTGSIKYCQETVLDVLQLQRDEAQARYNHSVGMIDACDDMLRMALKGGYEPSDEMPYLLGQEDDGYVHLLEKDTLWSSDYLLLGNNPENKLAVLPDPAIDFANLRDVVPVFESGVEKLIVR